LSDARHLRDERAIDAIARCKKQPADDYTGLFLGPQRAPRFDDERGAVAVLLEYATSKRIVIFPDTGDLRLVVCLPARSA
jgi:hypothetical protein